MLLSALYRNSPNRVYGNSLLKFLHHIKLNTHTHTHSRTPPSEWSSLRLGRYLHNTKQTRTNIPAFNRIPNSNPSNHNFRLTTSAVATLEPEPTQHNSLGRLQIRMHKWTTALLRTASRARRWIECAFGILTAKRRLLNKAIETKPKEQ
jgi:hypothetical protein